MTQDPIIIAWAAGLFDGEGTIGIVGVRVRVSIEMTDLDILERMQSSFGGKIYIQKKRQTHWKQSWRWQLAGSLQAKKFLHLIYEHLGVRRKLRCDVAFSLETKEDRKKIFVSRVIELRQQGLTHKAISDIMGVDRSHISHTLRKL